MNLSPDIRDHELGCPCSHCETWRMDHDPEYRAAVESAHWHAMYVLGVGTPIVTANRTDPQPDSRAARDLVYQRVKVHAPADCEAELEKLRKDLASIDGPLLLVLDSISYVVYRCGGEDDAGCHALQTSAARAVMEIEREHTQSCNAHGAEPEIGGYL